MSQQRPDMTDQPRAEQTRLPLVRAGEVPVPYALTARARRAVAPDGMPDLAVVGDAATSPAPDGPLPEDLDVLRDTRCAQARALRRAGVAVAAIAQRLAVDELVVASWVDDVGAPPTRPRTAGDGRRGHGRSSAAAAAPAVPVVESTRGGAWAREEAEARLTRDAAFAAGLGLVVGIADVDAHRILLATREQAVARAALRWLLDNSDVDPRRVGVVLHLGGSVPGDLARHRWAAALDVPLERVSQSRAGNLDAHEVRAVVRLADPVAASVLGGWRDALLGTPVGGTSLLDDHAAS